MHVVALNWRDLKNPLGGGAEVHIEEILRQLSRRGHRCTLISSGFRGAPSREEADGYCIVRAGHELNFNAVVPFAFRNLVAVDPADVVLDDINKVPFFSPLWTRRPVLAVIPHLMGATAFHEVNPILAAGVWIAERPVRLVYRRCRFEVISESTRDDLIARGFAGDRVHVVHCGMDRGRYRADPDVPKTATPSLVYVGRIKRYKAVDHAIRALKIVRERFPSCTLTVVGDGDGLGDLRRLAAELGLDGAVRFAGFVPHDEKLRILQSAHAAVNPSAKEGWGLTNVEANACGTVCVAADAPGLRDSVKDGVTGFLYPWGDVPAMAERIVRLFGDATLRRTMEVEALAWASSLTWERCGEETLALIERVVADARERPSSRSARADTVSR